MKIAVNYPNTIEVDKYRYFGSKRFSWYDWTNTKRAANTTAKMIRNGGGLARVVPMAGGYAIYMRGK